MALFPDTIEAGIVSLGIHEAADLNAVDSVFVQISLDMDDSAVHTTQRKKGDPNPIWNSVFDFYRQHLLSTTITIKVIAPHHLQSEVVGYLSLALEDMLESNKAGTQWWPLNGSRNGRIRLSIGWLAVDMTSS